MTRKHFLPATQGSYIGCFLFINVISSQRWYVFSRRRSSPSATYRSTFLGFRERVTTSYTTSCSAPSALGHQSRRKATVWRSLDVSSTKRAWKRSAAPVYRYLPNWQSCLETWLSGLIQLYWPCRFIFRNHQWPRYQSNISASTTLPSSRISSNKWRKGLHLSKRSDVDGTAASMIVSTPTSNSIDSWFVDGHSIVCNVERKPNEIRAPFRNRTHRNEDFSRPLLYRS